MKTPKLGLKADEIRLVPYDPDWPSFFEQESLRIKNALQDRALDIQHFGSTSVPGLMAKPIIDILIGLEDFNNINEIRKRMNSIGYEWCRGVKIPGDYTFGFGDPREFFAHIVRIDSPNWSQNLLFRDRLRSNPDLARSYAELKQNLARNYKGIRSEYTLGKTAFVTDAVKT